MFGLRKFWFQVVDEHMNPITTGLSISIGVTTLYSDENQTAKTNPVTGTITNGVVEFWYAGTSVDIIVSTVDGGISVKQTISLTTTERRIVLPTQQNVLEQAMPRVEFFDDFFGLGDDDYLAVTESTELWNFEGDGGSTATIADAVDGVGRCPPGIRSEPHAMERILSRLPCLT